MSQGDKLALWQKANDITDADLSRILKIDQSMISRYHKGERMFSYKLALEIIKVAAGDLTLEDIFTRTAA